MNIYLASRFSRLSELLEYKADLEHIGITVTSRWLLGGHEWVGTPDDQIPPSENAKFARKDLEDIDRADIVVCFTEESGAGPARGGRHWEAGYAYHAGKRIIVCGPRENVFYCLPRITVVDEWADALFEVYRLDCDSRGVAEVAIVRMNMGGVCRRGHPITPENIYERVNRHGKVVRTCRECRRIWRGRKR